MIIHGWTRDMGDKITFRHALTYLVFGVRGSGKSTLLEHIGKQFMKQGSPVIDLFGARSGEGLAWLLSPEVTQGGKRVLLVHGDNTEVAAPYDTKPVSRVTLNDLENYDLTISATPLYSSIDAEYRDVNRLVDLVFQRRVWTRPAFILVREAANLLYSRLKVSLDQTIAKAQFAYFIREARHCGFSLGVDTQKLTSIDLEIRVTIDYLFFKALGIQGLPSDLSWLYKFYIPLRLQAMHPSEFLLLTRMGSHGIGTFPFHRWHMEAGHDILKALHIEVQHSEELQVSSPGHRVGDLKHAKICEDRVNGYSFEDLAVMHNVSKKTVYDHISEYHNKDVGRLGACERCTRAKSQLAGVTIQTERHRAGQGP